jgi:3-isopropylmalate dehydrogenase
MTVKTVACLAGDGVGPELMAAATRALERVSKLHQLELDDRHLPFAGEAVTRSGHPLPPATRAGYRDVDAILVASPNEPALDGVKADLHLAWRVARVQLRSGGDIVVVGPVGDWANDIAISRAFSCAGSRHGRIVCVGESAAWRAAVAAQTARWGGLDVEEVSFGDVLVRLRDEPETLDVVVTEAHLVSAMVDAAAHYAGSPSSVANAWLPDEGPGVFAPGTAEPDDVAGFGVVDPEGMLLTASLMLAEGLKRRSASRTLERAVGDAADRNGHSRDTQAFTDAVIALLPQSRTDVEHFDGAWR